MFEVMGLTGDCWTDGEWVGVVHPYRDSTGAEYLPLVATFREEYADMAQEFADRLNVRDLAGRP
jgi:hypothetical protein